MFAEHGTLVASLVKWTLLATGVGILAGVGTAIFLRILDWAIRKDRVDEADFWLDQADRLLPA